MNCVIAASYIPKQANSCKNGYVCMQTLLENAYL